ncbi:MAG: nucleoside 2-deoxyribosyltransferase [Candidatus Scalindua sp.]|nr:nucleoside 2-deoxyribosyltransferase [Candidatus Scalindua sp.]
MDIKELSKGISLLTEEARVFFDGACTECDEDSSPCRTNRQEGRNAYWDKLTQESRQLSQKAQETLLNVVALIIPTLKASPVLNESDEKDVGRCVKRMRAALKLREYRSWDIEVLYDEHIVLGVNPPRQSEDECSSPADAHKAFEECLEQFEGITQLLKITPANIPTGLPSKNPNLSQSYRPNTAFIMMPIDNSDPDNEDICGAYKECFSRFGVTAVRADEIEHEDVITKRIIEEIRTSEFLIGDLTNERPSVYYEIGYAHSLGRRVILYRKAGTSIHFDLAAYNCPEYKNITELKSILMKRLEEATNRKPEQG